MVQPCQPFASFLHQRCRVGYGETVTETRTDLRSPRAERSRSALLDALEALVREGEPAPSAKAIAARAGLSTRSLFAHFPSLEELHRAMAERVTAQVVGLLHPVDPTAPLAARVVDVCEQRARVNEAIGPIRRAAALQRPTSPALREAREHSRQASTAQVERVFATDLAALDDGSRRRRVALIDAVLSGETWEQLSAGHGLASEEAVLALSEAVLALVAPTSPTSTAVDDPPPSHAGGEEASAGPDPQVERLLDALEAGAPAELVAPRLRRLHLRRPTPDEPS
jgi:AcrR family transcriptional regulator